MNRHLRTFQRWRMHTPRTRLGQVFEEVQTKGIFPDSKTFVDSVPIVSPRTIRALWKHQWKKQHTFDHEAFVREHFVLPEIVVPPPPGDTQVQLQSARIRDYIQRTWNDLKRAPDVPREGSSLLPLPYPYIVPGGRFREIYYWDSYFTMLGLRESGEVQMIEDMVNNFAHLIKTYGYIPNGNRSYYLSRSQPPFFSLMVQLLASVKGSSVYHTYLNEMVTEYQFWMFGRWNVWFMSHTTNVSEHVVRMPDGELLNRYYDFRDEPREESYREDVLLRTRYGTQRKVDLLRSVRAAAASGWDFSSRWCAEGSELATNRTLDVVPVDLNAILVMVENVIAEAYDVAHQPSQAELFRERARARTTAIQKYCWNESIGYFCDYVISEKTHSASLTLAGVFPLFAGVATPEQAARTVSVIRDRFLRPGGVVTTLMHTHEQWDAPNGWAPLHHATVMGLERYGYTELARDIAERWCRVVNDVFKRTGAMLEKYNVEDPTVIATGGEYELQVGFGWTNGVTLFFMNRYGIE